MTDNGNGKLPAMHQMVTGGKIGAIIPQSIEECYRLAQYVVASGWAPRDVKDPEAACVVIMHGLEVGVPPMAALQGIANINGRPCIWGDLALALVRASGLLESIEEEISGEGDAKIARCIVKRKGEPKPIPRKFSVADAKNAGLWGKRGQQGQPTPWVTYPERMLQMRARAWALRDAFADVLKGLHIREEVEDITPMRDVTPVPPAPPARPGKSSEPTGNETGAGVEPAQPTGLAVAPCDPSPGYTFASTSIGQAGVERKTAEDYPELPAELDRRKEREAMAERVAAEAARQHAEEAETVDEPQGMTPEELAAYLDEQGIRPPSEVDL